MQSLIVIALGGNAVSPPDASDTGYDLERARIGQTTGQLRKLAAEGNRLLIVHGNSPQIGRLLATEPGLGNLDIHTAQTQGELGYLVSRTLPDSVALITRVTVDPDPGPAVKAIGPKLAAPPPHIACRPFQDGWRAVVPSPLPRSVVELPAITALLRTYHVIAAGGGGIIVSEHDQSPNAATPSPAAIGVVDKDRTAALLAIELDAATLILATDVDGVSRGFGTPDARHLTTLTPEDCDALIRDGTAAAGSMAPKLESAARFVRATGRVALICRLDAIDAVFHPSTSDPFAGTRIIPARGNEGSADSRESPGTRQH